MASKYDVHFQLLPGLQQTSGKLFSFGYKAAIGVAGPQKLINRWMKVFLTPKGSDPFDRNSGTGFSALLGSNITNRRDVVDAIVLALEDCNAQIRAMDRRSMPPEDERLKAAVLTSVEDAGNSGFEIYISVSNAAGLTVAVPLPQV